MSGAVVASLRRRRRQFVITNVKLDGWADWREYAISPGWTLYYQQELAVELVRDGDGTPLVVLGNALRFDPSSCTGAGRFAVVRWPEITTDAAALMGIHYGREVERVAVSSSPGLAAEALQAAPRSPRRDRSAGAPLLHQLHPVAELRLQLSAQAPARPGARHPALRAPARALGDRPARLPSDAAALDALVGGAYRLRAASCAPASAGRIFMPLTGGLDSRTLLAAFVAVGVEVEMVSLDYVG